MMRRFVIEGLATETQSIVYAWCGIRGVAEQRKRSGRRSARKSIHWPRLLAARESSAQRWIAGAIFLVAFGYLLLFRHYTTIEPGRRDRASRGAAHPARRGALSTISSAFLTPGSFYLQALLFKLSVIRFWCRESHWLSLVGYSPPSDTCSRGRVCARWSALVAIALLTLTTLPYRFVALHNWDSTLLACLAVYCAVRMLESRMWLGICAGFVSSLTLLFEQSKGVGFRSRGGDGFCVRESSFAPVDSSSARGPIAIGSGPPGPSL